MNSDEKKVSLLEENIMTKGENSYYYAHKRLVETRNNADQGQVITGPGIITGGDPVLLAVNDKPVEVIKENKKFTKYVFIDEEEVATVKIDLTDDLKDKVSAEDVNCVFKEKSLELTISAIGTDIYYFTVTKLHKKIVPEESKYKISKGKLILSLKKIDDTEWQKLTE